jgi:chaperonin GroES
MSLRPLGDRVIIKRVEEEAVSAGGIVLPDSAKEKPSEGKIVAVGNGSTNDKGDTRPMSVKVGDNVLFGKYSGTEVEVEGEELLVMSEGDIIAVVE